MGYGSTRSVVRCRLVGPKRRAKALQMARGAALGPCRFRLVAKGKRVNIRVPCSVYSVGDEYKAKDIGWWSGTSCLFVLKELTGGAFSRVRVRRLTVWNGIKPRCSVFFLQSSAFYAEPGVHRSIHENLAARFITRTAVRISASGTQGEQPLT